jgi:hypothetical protein
MGNLKITKMEMIGADAKLFKMKGGGKKTISPGGQSTFSVTFTPSSIGSKAAVLRITSNDPDESVMEIALSGKGTDSIFTASNARWHECSHSNDRSRRLGYRFRIISP